MPLPTDPAELLVAARSGNRSALARLLSAIEGPRYKDAVRVVYPETGRAHVVGFTGAPGAGKSTLVDAVIGCLRRDHIDVGVICVDPSSPFSGGAILGDRVRMSGHAGDAGVFIRSMASRGALGGLAGAAPNAIRVLDAAGKEVILVETVGVGQVEIDIVREADTVVVVVNPRWGDSIQASKAGLLEIADIFVVNKADRPGVDETVSDLRAMLELAPADDAGEQTWRPPIVATVADTGAGVDELRDAIAAHRDFLAGGGRLRARRRSNLVAEVRNLVVETIGAAVGRRCRGPQFEDLIDSVARLDFDPPAAAEKLIADAGFKIDDDGGDL